MLDFEYVDSLRMIARKEVIFTTTWLKFVKFINTSVARKYVIDLSIYDIPNDDLSICSSGSYMLAIFERYGCCYRLFMTFEDQRV